MLRIAIGVALSLALTSAAALAQQTYSIEPDGNGDGAYTIYAPNSSNGYITPDDNGDGGWSVTEPQPYDDGPGAAPGSTLPEPPQPYDDR